MKNAKTPVHLLILAVADRLSRHQQRILEYLKEENRIFKEQLGGRRPRFTDDHPLAAFSCRTRIRWTGS